MNAPHPTYDVPGRNPVPAPTGVEAAAFDRHAIDVLGVPQSVLMENAGRSAAQLLQRLFPRGPVVVLVGAGNNGGDALVVLRTLAAWGREVRAVTVASRPSGEELLHAWPLSVVSDEAFPDEAAWAGLFGSAAVIVDGILGTGVQGAPRPRQASVIRRLNASGRPVLSLDIPSGVDAGTGAVPGEAVRARVTVSFGAPKLGTLLHPGRARAGRLIAVEIGFPPMEAGWASAEAVTAGWAVARLPRRALDTHKNAVGRVLVVAGRPGMAGAAVLATRGALRAGAGLVQVCSPPANREVLQAAVPEAIYLDPGEPGVLEDALEQAGALAVGPGLGTDDAAEALLARALRGGALPTVVDADGLNLLAQGRPSALPEALAGRPALLTPHLGELGRLTGRPPEDLRADRTATAREAAAALGSVVLFKGAPSLVAAAGAPVLVDLTGSSDLAAAGMGDVLTGVCAGLMAQGLAPRDAGAVGLYLTGRAAALAGRGAALTPTDVLRWLPEAMAAPVPAPADPHLPFVLLDLDAPR